MIVIMLIMDIGSLVKEVYFTSMMVLIDGTKGKKDVEWMSSLKLRQNVETTSS